MGRGDHPKHQGDPEPRSEAQKDRRQDVRPRARVNTSLFFLLSRQDPSVEEAMQIGRLVMTDYVKKVEAILGDRADDDEEASPTSKGAIFGRRITLPSVPKVVGYTALNTKELVDQGKMKADCSDLNFKSATTGANIPYYISPVPGCNAVETIIWLNPGEKEIDMTYGTQAKWLAPTPYKEPEVTTQSTKETLSLVQKLKKIDAKMYGAFWAPYSIDKLRAFGKEAMKGFPYVECFPAGYKKGMKMNQACETALKGAVKGYSMMPTWIIKGRSWWGTRTFRIWRPSRTSTWPSGTDDP